MSVELLVPGTPMLQSVGQTCVREMLSMTILRPQNRLASQWASLMIRLRRGSVYICSMSVQFRNGVLSRVLRGFRAFHECEAAA